MIKLKLKLKLKLLNANLTSYDKILCILHFTFSLFAIMPNFEQNAKILILPKAKYYSKLLFFTS